MDVKRGIVLVLLALCCTCAVAQERVILDTDYYKNEYINDKDNANKEYYAWAITGTAYTDARWRICRITYDGTTFVLQWADSNRNFDNVLSNYELLTYE